MTARRPPFAVVALGALAIAFVALPILGLLQRAPWHSVARDLTAPGARTALRLSLTCSVGATVIAIVLGVPLAWLLARVEFPGRALVRALAILPMVLPPVVGGVALLYAFGGHGLAGQWLDRWFGLQVAFTTTGAVLAEAFVAMPFLVVTVEAALRSADLRYEEAASSLGAHPGTVFRRVTLPMILPSLLAGIALAWARALGEFGATITFAGNLQGRTRTLPLAVYLALQSDPGAAVALSLLLLAVSITVLALLRHRWLGGA